jgi:hypothetical protein
MHWGRTVRAEEPHLVERGRQPCDRESEPTSQMEPGNRERDWAVYSALQKGTKHAHVSKWCCKPSVRGQEQGWGWSQVQAS